MDGDPHLDFGQPIPAVCLVDLRHRQLHGDGAADGARGIVGAGNRGPKSPSTGVADEIVDHSVVFEDHVSHRTEVVVHHLDDLFRGEALAILLKPRRSDIRIVTRRFWPPRSRPPGDSSSVATISSLK